MIRWTRSLTAIGLALATTAGTAALSVAISAPAEAAIVHYTTVKTQSFSIVKTSTRHVVMKVALQQDNWIDGDVGFVSFRCTIKSGSPAKWHATKCSVGSSSKIRLWWTSLDYALGGNSTCDGDHPCYAESFGISSTGTDGYAWRRTGVYEYYNYAVTVAARNVRIGGKTYCTGARGCYRGV